MINDDDLEEILLKKRAKKRIGVEDVDSEHANHEDHDDHGDSPHQDWDNHSDYHEDTWGDHDDTHDDHNIHTDTGAHQDWDNHSDSHEDVWGDHDDTHYDHNIHTDTGAHQDWDNHTDYAHEDWDDHDDWPWPHSDHDDHNDGPYYDWDNHTDTGPHQDWDNHSDYHDDTWGDHDDTHDDHNIHTDTGPHQDWDNHSDSHEDTWGDHDDTHDDHNIHTDTGAHTDHDDHADVAQECTQTFNIKDQDTDEELVVDTVSVDSKPVTRIVTTYTVTIDTGGTYTLKATKTGYNDLEESFTEDCAHILTFYMVPLPVKPYTINVTVKDENGTPIEGAYVDIDGCVLTCSEKECTDSDVAVYVGECKEEEWKGDGYNVVTNSEGKASIGLPVTEATGRTVDKWRIRVGKPGYLNESLHEDWTEFKEAEGGGTYNFEFPLTFITVEDKFVVSTIGFKEGDLVQCQRAYAWSKCLVTVPFSMPVFKAPDAYPDGKVEFTTADGLTEGEIYGIGPRIAGAIIPTGPSWCGEFRGTKEIEIPRYGILGSVCELLGIGAASDECRRFWTEMLDPVYCANCITGVLTGEDVHGAEYHPGKFELAMFPVVLVCSAIPWLPGAKITKFLGTFFKKAAPAAKHGDDVLAVRKYFEDEYLDIYRIQVRGDDARLTNWAKAIERGDIDGPDGARAWMRKILDDPAVLDADSVGYFDSMLDELTKQIDSIDPKHVDEIADLRARVLETANACMDDVTDFTKVYDEKYTEFIDVARRCSDDARVTTFVRAADKTCSPTPWHCKFSLINSRNVLKIDGEELPLLQVTKALYATGNTDITKPVFNNIFTAMAHMDKNYLVEIRTALEAGDSAKVVRLLNELPATDFEPRLTVRFFNKHKEHVMEKWPAKDDHYRILAGSGFNDEEIKHFAKITDRKLLWYRFADSDDLLENLVYNTVGNVSRAVKISDAGKSALMGLSYNNPKVMRNILRKLNDFEFKKITDNLNELTPPAKHEANLLERLRSITDEDLALRSTATQTDDWVALTDDNEYFFRELEQYYAVIKAPEYKGIPGDIATTLVNEFGKINRPRRLVAELDRVPKSWRTANPVAWGEIRTKAVQRLGELEPGWSTTRKYLIVDKNMKAMLKEVSKDVGKWLANPRRALPLTLGVFMGWWGYSLMIAWTFYEELPQGPSIRMYAAYKGGPPYTEVATELDFMKAELEALDAALDDPTTAYYYMFPIWKSFARDCLRYHWDSWRSFSVLIGRIPAAQAELTKPAYMVHAERIIDGDTFDSAMTEADMEERMIAFSEWATDNYAGPPPVEEIEIPLYGSIRLVGINAPDRPNEISDYHTDRMDTVSGARVIHRTTHECYDRSTEWLYGQIKGRDVKLLIDPADQYDKYNRVLGKVKYGEVDICKRSLEDGASMVFFYRYNIHVDSSPLPDGTFLKAEKNAIDNKLLLWSSECQLCPATAVKFGYGPAPREDIPVTFTGGVLGCDPSEITDWKWYKDGVFWKEGQTIIHTFTSPGSHEITLEVCAGALSHTRTITVSKAYSNRKSPCAPYGNVNNDADDYVNDTDAKLVRDYIEEGWDAVKDKVGGLTKAQFEDRADVNDDDKVGNDDADAIYEFYEGTRNTFPICPVSPPGVKNVKIIAPSSVDVGTTATLVGMAATEAPYVVDTWIWTITDPDGIETTKNGKTITQLFNKVGAWGIRLKACNNTSPPNCSSATKTITVESYVPPPAKGDLTIITYATRKFVTPLAIETFYIDGATVAGTYSCTKINLLVSENPHTVKIDFKDAPHTCYVDKLDECFDTCEFGINIVKDVVTTIRVCSARGCLFLSDPSGASVYIKQVDAPSEDYEEISASYVLPLGTYSVRFSGLSGYGSLEAVIRITSGGVVCENVITLGGHCYTDPGLVTRPGLLVSGFLIKSFPKEAVTKTVTFESVPIDAVISVLD